MQHWEGRAYTSTDFQIESQLPGLKEERLLCALLGNVVEKMYHLVSLPALATSGVLWVLRPPPPPPPMIQKKQLKSLAFLRRHRPSRGYDKVNCQLYNVNQHHHDHSNARAAGGQGQARLGRQLGDHQCGNRKRLLAAD
jgi:hypothetical protein